MEVLKFLGWAWIVCLIIFAVGVILGVWIENYLKDSNPIKKWWRRNIVDYDPEDKNPWKNFNG